MLTAGEKRRMRGYAKRAIVIRVASNKLARDVAKDLAKEMRKS